MLSGQNNRLQTNRLAVLIILYGNLALSIGTKVRQRAVLTHLCQLSGQLVCKRDRIRHQLRSLVCRIAKHHTLVSGTDRLDLLITHLAFPRLQRFVNTHGNVRRLLVQCYHYRTGIAVKTDLGGSIPDLIHGLSHNACNIQVCLGGDLTGHQNKSGAARCLTGHAAHRILLHACIQNRIRHCITELIGMSFGYRFGSK